MRTILLTAALFSSTALAQAPKPTPKAEGQLTPSGAQKWVRQLGSESYRERLQAENKLRQLGESARDELERAAQEGADREVQWRAKRLLRQLGRGEPLREPGSDGLMERRRGRESDQRAPEIVERRTRAGGSGPGVDDVRKEFDRIFKRFEDMGLDVPSRRFFDAPFFQDLRSQWNGGVDVGGASQSMSVQVGPDGVRVEVVEQGKDGQPETKVYEAPDMETFQKNHPGVLKGGGLGLGFGEPMENLRGRIGKLERGFDWDIARPRALRLPQPPPASKPASAPQKGQRLGVTVKPIPSVLREYLGLGDEGLMVGEVQVDTLAAACGLLADDIVLEIGGRSVASPADVAEALSVIKKGEEVRVVFLRRGRREVAEAMKQHDAATEREVLKPRGQVRDRPEIR